ncbi:MAG: redoxin domain-containing protein [Planctomycetes bacterium]|nr:redoxin domain-containing protein [Planctomycetota bacterium]
MVLMTMSFAPRGLAQQSTDPPDEQLWAAIQSLARPSPTVASAYSARFEAERQRREALVEKLRTYQRIYPGGVRRDSAIGLEFETLFEIGSLSGDFSGLAARIVEHRGNPSSRFAESEAAWWEIQLRGLSRQAAPKRGDAVETPRLAALGEFVRAHPDSPHVPQAVTVLGQDALRRGDAAGAKEWIQAAQPHFEKNALVVSLAAAVRRTEATGKPFASVLRTVDGQELDTTKWVGQTVVLVVWETRDARQREFARQVEQVRAGQPGIKVVAIALDDSSDAARRSRAEMKLGWPLCCDGRACAGEFVRAWGVCDAPWVFVIGRDGTLAAAGTHDRWEVLLSAIGGGTTQPSTQPAD